MDFLFSLEFHYNDYFTCYNNRFRFFVLLNSVKHLPEIFIIEGQL